MLDKPYTILKSALFDVSDYVHSGVAIEDIEEIIETALTADGRKGMCRPVPGFLAYDIKTNSTVRRFSHFYRQKRRFYSNLVALDDK